MNDTTVLYALSTIAQTCAALAAFVGAIGVFRLQRLYDERARLEASIRPARFELAGHDSAVTAHSIANIVEWFHAYRDRTQPAERGEAISAALLMVDAWCVIPSRLRRARAALISFEVWNVGAIGAALIGFNHVGMLASRGLLTAWLLWVLVIGTVLVTLACVGWSGRKTGGIDMAQVIQRIWKSGPRKVRRTAWGYTLQVDGKQIRKYDAAWSKEDAERALAEWTLGIKKALPAEEAVASPAGMTFGAMVEKFLDEKRAEGKRSLADDEERSVPLLAFFDKHAPVTSITTRRVAEYRVARLGTKSRRKRLLAPATVNRECALLRSILRMALAWEEIARLPVFKMAKEEGKGRYLTPDEITRLLAACEESRNKRLLALVTVDLHTGLRKGELLGLTWEQVDFARGVIVLGRRTKSGKARDVPINQAVYGALAPLRAAAGGQDAAGRVWGEITKIDTAYNAALVRAKILDPDVNFHTLRHTFASHYVMRGGSLVKLQAILGHASIRTTQIYAHLAPDHLSGATALLEGLGTPAFSTTSAHEAMQTAATTRGVV